MEQEQPTPEIPETPETSEASLPSTATSSPSPEADAAVEASAADAAVAVAEPSAPTPATDDALLLRTLEALLFITDRPLSAGELGKIVGVKDQEKIAGCVEELRRDLEARNAGYRLIAVAEGWQMATRPELAGYVRKLFTDRATMRLSTAAQETLSIISYRQPLTRAEIEQIRGVEVIAALETLLEKRLVKVVGRKESVGRPLMYGTTVEFLRHFGLRSLEDLPPLDTFAPADAAGPDRVEGPFEGSVPVEIAQVISGEAPAPAPEPEAPAAPAAPEAEDAAPGIVSEVDAQLDAQASAEAPASDEDSLWPK